MSTTYINPALPSMIRGLYRAELREKSIQNMLDLAADLIQELIELRAERAEWEAEQGAEEPEWEYGNEQLMHSYVEVFPASSEAVAKAQAWLYPVRRRRKAGPWEPVEQGDGDADR